MATSEALHLTQKSCYKSGKAKACGLHSASFKATNSFSAHDGQNAKVLLVTIRQIIVQQYLQIATQTNYRNSLTRETIKCILYMWVLANP